MFADFPLLDRGQPPLPGERRAALLPDRLERRLPALAGHGDERDEHDPTHRGEVTAPATDGPNDG